MPVSVGVDAQHGDRQVVIGRGEVEYVPHFKYLGSLSSASLTMQPEIASRLAKAGSAFYRLNKAWADKFLSRDLKCSVYKSIVQATLLYACETWAAPKAMLASLDTFQMRCLRRICGISLRQHMTNESIRGHCQVEAVSTLVRYRRLRWLGHLARLEDDRLPKQLLFGSLIRTEHVPGKAGRPLKSWIDYVREDLHSLHLGYSWYRHAQDRASWRSSIQKLLEHT